MEGWMTVGNISRAFAPLLVAAALVLSGCSIGDGGVRGTVDMVSASFADGVESTTENSQQREPCEDGHLVIGDLPSMDGRWQIGIENGTEKALAWHQDARLVELRVNCALFEPGFRWQTSFYSGEAQAIYATDTGESVPVSLEPDQVVTLDLSSLSFARLREALNAEGFTDDLVLSPTTGVDIRINSAEAHFGPADAPVGRTLAHVSVNRLGEIKDIFIDISTGEVYRFTFPSG